MRLTSSDDEILDLKRYLFKWLDSNKDRNLLVLNAEADEILDKILTIFEGKVGAKLSPVSYTHLDVYKRQNQWLMLGNPTKYIKRKRKWR